MTDIIVEYLKQGVNLFLNSLTIVMIVGTFAVVSVISTAVSTQDAANKKMAEEAEFNQFTRGDDVRGSDVIATLMEYRNSIEIVVVEGGTEKIKSTTVSAANYNLKYLSSIVSPESKYTPEVTIDKNEVIESIKFTLQP